MGSFSGRVIPDLQATIFPITKDNRHKPQTKTGGRNSLQLYSQCKQIAQLPVRTANLAKQAAPDWRV